MVELTKELIKKIVDEYPKGINCVPREDFKEQMKQHLMKYTKE